MKDISIHYRTDSAIRPQPTRVLFVGLSNKPGRDALPADTASGAIIDAIEKRLPGIDVFRTNATTAAPLDAQGQLRYPTELELRRAFPVLRKRLAISEPAIVVPLGAIVTRFLLKRLGVTSRFSTFDHAFRYQGFLTPTGRVVLPIHHPSYIVIYRRVQLDLYVRRVCSQLKVLARGQRTSAETRTVEQG